MNNFEETLIDHVEKYPDEWLKYVNGSQVFNSALTMKRKKKRGSEDNSVRDTNLSDSNLSNFSDSDYSNSDIEENEERSNSQKGSEKKFIKRVKT